MIFNYFRKRGKSFVYAFSGIRDVINGEPNAKIHLFFTAAAIFCGIFFHISKIEWCLISIVIGFVWSAEIFNTSIENTVDLYTLEYHEKARRAKDMAAGAVLIAAATSVVVGLIIFLPKFLSIF